MTVLTPPPELDSSGGPRLSVVLAVAGGLLLLLSIAAVGLIGASSMRQGDDWASGGWAGDPAAVESLAVSAAFNEADSYECISGKGSRCYVTSLGVKAALAEVSQALGASTYDTVEQRFGTAYTVCGQVEGTPIFGIVRPHVENAISTGPGVWEIREEPTFDGRLSVTFVAAVSAAPTCP